MRAFTAPRETLSAIERQASNPLSGTLARIEAALVAEGEPSINVHGVILHHVRFIGAGGRRPSQSRAESRLTRPHARDGKRR
jgi:hypothetical protein